MACATSSSPDALKLAHTARMDMDAQKEWKTIQRAASVPAKATRSGYGRRSGRLGSSRWQTNETKH